MRHLLLLLSGTALTALLLALNLQEQSAALWRHLLFAMGVMPLILGAILYFVPVLTRSRPAQGVVLMMPVGALLVGFGAVLGFAFDPAILPHLAGLALLPVGYEMHWLWRQRKQALAAPHPGLYWYLGALAMLMLALALIFARLFWPAAWGWTRVVHLHLNLFGLLGLTAIGTLRVLLPTTLGVIDATAARFLQSELPYVLFGTLLIALGAAVWWPLALFGASLWLRTSLLLLKCIHGYAKSPRDWSGAAFALIAAVFGWCVVLVVGLAHGMGAVSSDTALQVLLYAFLLPLVTGATSYLLPVWRWPGAQSAVHAQMRVRLMAYSWVRILAFETSAVLALTGVPWAGLPSVLALLVYLAQLLNAFVRQRLPATPA